MLAQVGDWIVIESGLVDMPGREGQIVALRHPDGSPPYDVRWLADGQTTLFFPGPDARALSPAGYQARARRRGANALGRVRPDAARIDRPRPDAPLSLP